MQWDGDLSERGFGGIKGLGGNCGGSPPCQSVRRLTRTRHSPRRRPAHAQNDQTVHLREFTGAPLLF